MTEISLSSLARRWKYLQVNDFSFILDHEGCFNYYDERRKEEVTIKITGDACYRAEILYVLSVQIGEINDFLAAEICESDDRRDLLKHVKTHYGCMDWSARVTLIAIKITEVLEDALKHGHQNRSTYPTDYDRGDPNWFRKMWADNTMGIPGRITTLALRRIYAIMDELSFADINYMMYRLSRERPQDYRRLVEAFKKSEFSLNIKYEGCYPCPTSGKMVHPDYCDIICNRCKGVSLLYKEE